MERISYESISEEVLRGMMKNEEYLRNCGLNVKELDLMRFRVSQINNCAYCLDMHSKEAIHAGETPLRLYSVSAWREAPYYSEREKAILEFAEALTCLPERGVDDNIYSNMQKHFSNEEIANLTLAVVQINSWNRIVSCFRPTPGKYRVKQLQS